MNLLSVLDSLISILTMLDKILAWTSFNLSVADCDESAWQWT